MLNRVLFLGLVAYSAAAPLQEHVAVSAGVTGVECTLCNEAVKYLGEGLEKIEPTIEKYLADICKILPSDDQSQCNTLINQFGKSILDEIIKLFEETGTTGGGNDKEVCDALGLCSTMVTAHTGKPVFVNNKGDLCQICESVLGEIATILKNPADQQKILSEIDTLVPCGPFESICKEFIDDEGAKLLDWLASEIVPDTFCKDIDAC